MQLLADHALIDFIVLCDQDERVLANRLVASGRRFTRQTQLRRGLLRLARRSTRRAANGLDEGLATQGVAIDKDKSLGVRGGLALAACKCDQHDPDRQIRAYMSGLEQFFDIGNRVPDLDHPYSKAGGLRLGPAAALLGIGRTLNRRAVSREVAGEILG